MFTCSRHTQKTDHTTRMRFGHVQGCANYCLRCSARCETNKNAQMLKDRTVTQTPAKNFSRDVAQEHLEIRMRFVDALPRSLQNRVKRIQEIQHVRVVGSDSRKVLDLTLGAAAAL